MSARARARHAPIRQRQPSTAAVPPHADDATTTSARARVHAPDEQRQPPPPPVRPYFRRLMVCLKPSSSSFELRGCGWGGMLLSSPALFVRATR
jgi:hypothetical protein